MNSWLAELFERHGSRYLVGALAALLAEVMLVVVPAITFFPAHYEGLTAAQYLTVVGAAGVVGISLLAIYLTAARAEVRSLVRWCKTRSAEDAERARRIAFDGPRQLGLLELGLGALIAPGLIALLAIPSRHTTLLDWLELSVGAALSVLLGAINAWFTLDVLMRPVRAAFKDPPANLKQSSLVGRLAVIIPSTMWLAACAVGYLTTTRAKAGPGHLFLTYGIGAACAVLCLTITAPLFIGALASPIRELARATRDVAAGRFSTRVPVTSSDELGQLAASFNVMLDELEASRVRIVTASDAARRSVERNLHDGAQQRLVLLKLKINLLKRDPSRTGLILEISEELDRALAEMRDLARGLYPIRLQSDGLPGALSDAAGAVPIPTSIDCAGVRRHAPELEAAVYFCCLEALQNAAKHAGEGAKVRLSISEGDCELLFAVTDDGPGFEPRAARGGAGLQNMSDRIGALGGRLDITTGPGSGTTVSGAVPVPQTWPRLSDPSSAARAFRRTP